ncbi:MAG: Re/Si-specific NAD(P)(+) transhydrogenase subunit alpha [Rhodospirillaceae bacterium]|jgi:H+-translocating NAD(P) transhydrogenase subunit alpha|nr:Re/Si-specific NAD(P)(+) transhydrogenase subunit alpha [Rhodospirillaceae bacterium]MBT5457690.1 Re/Si-specific NAD(P)(+) transhydrogenase subunit alpha [Rhodospirillaceae bacterium]
MKIAIPRERRPNESRVAGSPDTVKKLIALGFDVIVETGAGDGASIPDSLFADAGASIAADEAAALGDADIVLKVQRPLTEAEGGPDELSLMKSGAILIGTLSALTNPDQAASYAAAGVTAFAMELLPRISRAQSMDVLSSQSNLAGYKAVLDAAHEFTRAFPMMMTAAGTIPPARVLVLGVGVAGLQAIATARRLGAVVMGYDVRPAVKEQVESLGAKFVEVDSDATEGAETTGGYAKEMGDDYKAKQAQVLSDTLAKQDIAICTALIPGHPAPVLITEEMVKGMKPGSVIVDLAVEQGGNCPLSEFGSVVVKHGVTLVGHANVPSRIATDATAMYAKNLLNFVTPLVDAETKALAIDWSDEIIEGCLVTRDGQVVHPDLSIETKATETA